LRQVCLAAYNYLDTNGTLPPGTLPSAKYPPDKRLSWLVLLLPYYESDNSLWLRTNQLETWDSEANRHLVETHVRLFVCPATPQTDLSQSYPVTQYIGLAGVGTDAATLPLDDKRAGIFGYDRSVRLQDIKDGTSSTIIIMETAMEQGPWAAGGPATVRGLDPSRQPYLALEGQFGLKHRADTFFRTNPVGSNVAFADGSVRWLLSSVSSETLEALATIAAGDTPGDY
jgi:prepilin-type processing-associated H-X9-DG protein